MKVTGIIAEYNPLHNGHLYHIEEAKKLTGADSVVVVMSGDFVQRGTPAIINKYIRAHAAILCGADFVFELPACYATGSAEFFAEGAVRLLDSLGITDFLCFGSECGDIDALSKIADILLNEPQNYRMHLLNGLKSGNNYASARSSAFKTEFPEYASILDTPNNILGIEYIKAIKKFNSKITPCTITRKGHGYNDILISPCQNHEISFEKNENIISAAAIRKMWREHTHENDEKLYIPEAVLKLYLTEKNKSFPVYENDFSSVLYYKLYNDITGGISLSEYSELNNGLANRIEKLLPKFKGFSDFSMLIKNKSYTYSRICRCLTHILLDIKDEDLCAYRKNGHIFYHRLLGIKNNAKNLAVLKAISKNANSSIQNIPLLTTFKDINSILKSDTVQNPEKAAMTAATATAATATAMTAVTAKRMLKTDILASDIYEHISGIKYARNPVSEAARRFLTVDQA